MIPWGEWRPNAGPNSGFAEIADGVIPQSAAGGIGYGPFPDLLTGVGAEALPAAPRGIISTRLLDGTWRVYAATATTIEVMDSLYQWSSIDTGRAVTDPDDVSFVHFGSYLLNTDTSDGFKAYNVEVPAGNNTVPDAPSARFIFPCNNVIFALDCDTNNRRFQSSGVGDHTAWRSKGANGLTLTDGGALVAGCDLKNGMALMFQEDAVRGIQFGAGGGSLYSLVKIADGKGSVGARSVVSFDGTAYWLSTDGFYRLTAGGAPEPIGAERIDRWFFDQVPVGDFEAVQGAVDPYRKIVVWRISATKLLGFAWALNGGAGAWFTATASTSTLSRIATTGLLADDWNVIADDQDIPMDSRTFDGTQPVFSALDADYKFATFTGSNMARTLRGCEINNPVTGMGRWLTPISDGPASKIRVGTRDSLSGTQTWTDYATKVRNGAVPLRFRGLNIQIEEVEDAVATWTYSNGVDNIDKSTGGRR